MYSLSDDPNYQALIDSGDIQMLRCWGCGARVPVYHSTGEQIWSCQNCVKDTVVFTNGCFDLIHLGHIYLFHYCWLLAKDHGKFKVVVGLNGDKSFEQCKGRKPIWPAHIRSFIIESIRYVHEVKIFHEPTPLELIKRLKPSIIVKGGDYKAEDVVGYKECQAWGGQVVICPYDAPYSTTAIRRRIYEDERSKVQASM